MWLYGSGFPKSLNIGKAIDKKAGVKFKSKPASGVGFMNPEGRGGYNNTNNQLERVGESTDEAKQWDGWGTALKPAHEPIVVARKPVQGTVAENVLEHGTGGINIDESRIGTEFRTYKGAGSSPQKIANHTKGDTGIGMLDGSGKNKTFTVEGRFPANVIHDGVDEPWGHYFYCAKASKKDRDEGLEALETPKENLQGLDTRGRTLIREDGTKSLVERWKPKGERKNNHPTVKPTDLMRYLCRLVTPPGGVVLDPFMGSGSTGKAAQKEGFEFIGIEREPEYVEIARQRI
jgi:site-specific DNA-methyltransferase (adenine-specific)